MLRQENGEWLTMLGPINVHVRRGYIALVQCQQKNQPKTQVVLDGTDMLESKEMQVFRELICPLLDEQWDVLDLT